MSKHVYIKMHIYNLNTLINTLIRIAYYNEKECIEQLLSLLISNQKGKKT